MLYANDYVLTRRNPCVICTGRLASLPDVLTAVTAAQEGELEVVEQESDGEHDVVELHMDDAALIAMHSQKQAAKRKASGKAKVMVRSPKTSSKTPPQSEASDSDADGQPTKHVRKPERRKSKHNASSRTAPTSSDGEATWRDYEIPVSGQSGVVKMCHSMSQSDHYIPFDVQYT